MNTYIALPTRRGYCVMWYTGKTIRDHRVRDMWHTSSKEKAEKKAKDLKAQGFEIDGIYECIY